MAFLEDPETGLIEQFAGYFDLEDADIDVLRDPNRTRSMQALLDIEGCAADADPQAARRADAAVPAAGPLHS